MELPKLQGREERDKKRIMVMELLKLWKKKRIMAIELPRIQGRKRKKKRKEKKGIVACRNWRKIKKNYNN